MEPDYWAIYLETSGGVLVEPYDCVASPVRTGEDSVYSEQERMHFSRRMMTREITLYFKETTFFGEELLGADNPYLILALSRERQTVARMAWKLNEIRD